MNKYEDIRRELESLGWTGKQGPGDHILYDKPGNRIPITVPIEIDENKRTYQNIIARIRRAEPRFTLGRPAKKKRKEGDTKEETPETDGNLPPYIRTGRMVRYTSPEGRDWSRLSDPTSLMSKLYEVTGVSHNPGSPSKIMIRDPEHGAEFEIGPDDIDSEETVTCAVCGKTVPVSEYMRRGLVPDPKRPVCPDCAKAREAEERKLAKARRKPPQGLDGYENTPMASIPEDKLEDILDKANKAMRRAPKSVLKDDVRRLAAMISPEKAKTPFDAWNRYLTDMEIRYSAEGRTDAGDKKAVLRDRSAVRRTSYTVRKAGTRDILEIESKDWTMTVLIWMYLPVLYDFFAEVFPVGKRFAVLLNDRKQRFSQYLLNPLSDNLNEEIGSLKSETGKDGSMFDRITADSHAVPLMTIHNEVCSTIKSILGSEDGLPPYVKAYPHYALPTSDNDDDIERTPPVPTEMVGVDTVAAGGAEALEKLKRNLTLLTAGTGKTVTLQSTTEPGEDITYSSWEPSVTPAGPGNPGTGNGDRPGERADTTLMRVFLRGKDIGYTTAVSEQEDKLKETVKEGVRRLLETDKEESFPVRDAILEAAAEHLKKRNNNNTDKKTKDMNGKDIIDMTNPESGDERLRDLTTRELLSELKDRGVTFTGLAITIRKEIDINEI